ncbi:DEAD/DEAH box helicase [Nocardioides mangrovicus]|uniref:DEAD/DEAH box helicase n=1 Tax=Nocardioides mangrovicus TaxID=2478913 RepID=A0A3L8P453_9ACTN|nr:DEAD/DEAH box helicase [Nocardioides mangrovicus]RLV49817.1 DEAD/DEAH box helicase [Nocardioides mangrovicus]
MPVLARAVREVENNVRGGRAQSWVRTQFQVIAILVREERARMKVDPDLSEAQRAEQLKRLDGVATILAKTATRDTSLLMLLAEDAEVSDAARALKREMVAKAGLEAAEEPEVEDDVDDHGHHERQVVPQSVISRQLANPFLAPDFSHVVPRREGPHRLATWELLGPLFRSFEKATDGKASCMTLPEPTSMVAGGRVLMNHQAQLVESAAAGHRTFLLADEPGLGKTAQALLAAQAADAFPLLVVVPNVVKTNWAREVELWLPTRRSTVIHGDGADVDGFADVVIVNYDILDRHVGWLGVHGFRGMVVDEAHFIKNKSSQRSQHVLQIADRIRARSHQPLMMALTGTPLINDIEDFRAIWQFLGWIDDKRPTHTLMDALEDTGLTPAEPSFYSSARRAVIDLGIVRRRKVDVAADIPARRVADLPVELDGELGRSIREAERELARRMVARYDKALETRISGKVVEGIDRELVHRVATWEREDSDTASEENVFTMMRRIGQAKAGLAADYAAQLVRNVGKVVFFAKHVDVMDEAEKLFANRGIGYSVIRGDQTAKARQENIDAFTNDPDVSIIVCSLMAAGVGINLQVSSNVVLAELSWTDAEQTQAIDRVHRIGQEEPVTAWRVIASQTLDTKIAELIDDKAGLAARALDGSDAEIGSSTDLQLAALEALLLDALEARG